MITYQHYQAGYCKHCERITLKGGRLKKVRYPSLCTLIQHPVHGNILYDTGYSQRFCDATKRFPERLYQLITPVTQTKDLKTQLEANGIHPDTIRYIIISHFHSDHLGGLKDFPNATFICHKDAWESVRKISRIHGLRKAFMKSLLPEDFEQRLWLLDKSSTSPLPESLMPFSTGYTLFQETGANPLYAVELPGHAAGHIGLYFKAHESAPVFLIGDSCWHHQHYREKHYPSRLTHLIHDDPKQYRHTIDCLHTLFCNNPSLNIIPSHEREIMGDIS